MLKANRVLEYWQGLFWWSKETRKELKSNVKGWHLENFQEIELEASDLHRQTDRQTDRKTELIL